MLFSFFIDAEEN